MASPFITLLDSSNTPIGPFPLAEVQRRLAAGEFRADQLAHTEGLSQWMPLSTVLTRFQLPPTPLTSLSPANPPPYQATEIYAGFWLRFVAYLLDTMLVIFVFYAFFVVLMLITDPHGFVRDLSSKDSHSMDNAPFLVKMLVMIVFIFGPLTYFALMESSAKQASLGKMALGLKVTDLQSRRLSFWHAFGRNAAKMITNMTCIVFYIGYMLAGFTEKKQALHDMIASTLVWRK
jgi:uncharacterized RDD family membrane protein YckC